jgi:ABC-2 type transport system ATP-binding protein
LSKDDIGFVPQDISLIEDMSLKENLVFFGALNGLSSKKSIENGVKLMSLLSLKQDLNKYPNQMSGGQKVRFNIIVSLLHNPKMIIMDEPFCGFGLL